MANWIKELNDKYRVWNEEESQKIPNVMRNEYLKTFDLLAHNQIYGVFLQIKDTLEIILKFIVLTVISELLEQKNVPDDNNDIAFKLFEKPLSLGDWETICFGLKNKSQYSELNILTDAICEIYRKNSITKWRNDYIGHGALPNIDSDSFTKDVISKIDIINLFFADNLKHFQNIDYNMGDSVIEFRYKANKEFNIKYFSHIDDGKVFLFDSYNFTKKKSAFLNYSHGIKIEIELRTLNLLIDRLQFDNSKRIFKSSLDDGVFSVIEDNVINESFKIDDYIRPEHIISDINKFIQENDRGVLLLQMEKGMGKTIFCNAIDEFGLNRIKFENCIVRGYYINDTYKSYKSTFVSEINDLFRIDEEGKVIYRGNIPYVNEQKSNLKEEVSKILTFYRDKYKNDFGKEKLVFFVDGLDEIVPQKDGSIFDYLPNNTDLSENVYIIYTLRTNEELKDTFFILNNISKISYSQNILLTNSSQEYREILKSYLKKKYRGIDNVRIDKYLNTSAYTFLYLKRICKIINNNQSNINVFTDEFYKQEILDIYNRFGEKYFERILDILILLALFNEPLNISIISELLYNEKLNFEFLFFIIHFKQFFYYERTLSGNCIRIADSDFNTFLKQEYTKRLKEIANKLIAKCLEELKVNNANKFDISIYILSNLNKFIENSDYKIKDFTENNILNRILDIEYTMSRKDIDSLKRVSRMQAQIFEILNTLDHNNPMYNIYKAILESNQAEVYDLLGFTERSKEIFYESVKKLNNVEFEKFPYILLLSCRTYIKYALLCIKINENHLAVISLSNALKLYNNLEKTNLWKPDLKDYLYIYSNRGIAYQNLNLINEAESEYKKAIELLNSDINQNEELNLQISMLYLNYGVICLYKGKEYFDEAINHYNKAFEYIDSDSDLFLEQKARIFLNKSKVFLGKGEKEEALSKIGIAISILESLKEKNLLIDDEILMKAYTNKGIILEQTAQYNQSISNLKKAVEIGNNLIDEGKYINEYELFKANFLQADVYIKLNLHDEELLVYRRLMENVNFKSREVLLIVLSSFNNFIALLDKEKLDLHIEFILNKFDELLQILDVELNDEESKLLIDIIIVLIENLNEKKTYNKAIEYQKYLLTIYENQEDTQEIRALLLKDIGNNFINQKSYDNAMEFYNASIRLMREIENFSFELKKYLAEMLYNRSVIFTFKELYQNAYNDANNSLSITYECLKNNVSINKDFVKQRVNHLMMLHSILKF
jgi:hypothetical protein